MTSAAFVNQYPVCLEVCFGKRVNVGRIAWVLGVETLYKFGQRCRVLVGYDDRGGSKASYDGHVNVHKRVVELKVFTTLI